MPYSVNDGAILEVTIKGRCFGQVCMNVFHYKLDSTFGIPDGDAAIEAFNVEWNDAADFLGAWAACTSFNLSIDQLVYQWIYPIRYHRVVHVPTGGVVQNAGDALAANISTAVTKLSEKATRHSRGTLHMPAVPTTFIEEGELTAAGITAYDGFLPFVDNDYRTGTLLPVLFNRNQPADSERIFSARLERTSRVNRRRTVGVGE